MVVAAGHEVLCSFSAERSIKLDMYSHSDVVLNIEMQTARGGRNICEVHVD